MNAWSPLGKLLVAAGLVLVALGVLLVVAGRWAGPQGRLLPGDIVIRRGSWSLYLPLATCLLVSAVLTLVLYLLTLVRR